MKIKLSRNKNPENPGYTYTDSKERTWKVTPTTDKTWDVEFPEYGDREGDTMNFTSLNDVRARIANLLETESMEDKVAQRIRYTKQRVADIPLKLQLWIEDGEKARKGLIDRLGYSGALCYEIGWGSGLKEDFRAKLANELLEAINTAKVSMKEAVEWYHKEWTRQLVEDHYTSNSTSVMRNAVNEIKRDVTSTMVRETRTWVRYLDDEESLEKEKNG